MDCLELARLLKLIEQLLAKLLRLLERVDSFQKLTLVFEVGVSRYQAVIHVVLLGWLSGLEPNDPALVSGLNFRHVESVQSILAPLLVDQRTLLHKR